ncbi:hypothetical protein [Variovorax sp. UC122_21]|uniref:hypothetical protein n=1 Tax=Variovorax sp. UC122_21 TaxID=3374554 RepID=UPI003756AFC9
MPSFDHALSTAARESVADIHHHFGGGVYAKETHVPAGMWLVQHKHKHDHLSILSSGTVEVFVEGQRTEMVGPACICIPGGVHHGIRAMTDAIWFCVHATDCKDEDEVDDLLVVPSDPTEIATLGRAMA